MQNENCEQNEKTNEQKQPQQQKQQQLLSQQQQPQQLKPEQPQQLPHQPSPQQPQRQPPQQQQQQQQPRQPCFKSFSYGDSPTGSSHPLKHVNEECITDSGNNTNNNTRESSHHIINDDIKASLMSSLGNRHEARIGGGGGKRDPLSRTKSDGILSSPYSHSYSRNISPSDIKLENLLCQKMMRRRTGLSSHSLSSSSLKRSRSITRCGSGESGSGPIDDVDGCALANQRVAFGSRGSGSEWTGDVLRFGSLPIPQRCVMIVMISFFCKRSLFSVHTL